MVVIVMGIAGSGKSTIGSLLASRLSWRLVEGDDYHSPSSVVKMRAGIPLTDADRQPWLEKLTALITGWNRAGEDAVLTCSALKRDYREQLGLGDGILYVYLKGSRDELEKRLRNRKSHFAGVELLESQLATLEEPADDEPAITVALSDTPERIVDRVVRVVSDRAKPSEHPRRMKEPAMLTTNDKVTIRYRDATGEVIEQGWTVVEYDDGLVKLHIPAVSYREGSSPDDIRLIPARTRVVNMRSSSFLSADLE